MADSMESFNRKWRTLWVWSHLYFGFKTAQARSRLLSAEDAEEYWKKQHTRFAEVVWKNIAELRGWWVKIGQFLSTRSDILPEAYIRHLVKLQDMLPLSRYEIVVQTIEEELEQPLNEIFDSFEETAIASASIAQVHRARLKTGEDVVVKVQHLHVDKTLAQDMNTLMQLSWALGVLEKGMKFGSILDEWQTQAALELDFRFELAHQERARLTLEKSRIDVVVPKCYPHLTTKRVLVMEYCEGFKITNKKKLKEFKVDKRHILHTICDCFAYQIHSDGMFNGDPHPGNILVQIKPDGTARPVLLDWGLVKVFSNSSRIAFSKAILSVASMDVMGLISAFEEMGFRFRDDVEIDPEVYMDALRVGFFRKSGEYHPDITEDEQAELLEHAQKQGLNRKTIMESNPLEAWPREIIFFIRVASLLHGLCIQLDEKLALLEILVKRAKEALEERFEVQDAMEYCALRRVINFQMNDGKMKRDLAVHRILVKMFLRKRVLGAQVAVCHHGELVVCSSVGKLGPVDSRPVQSNSLFCIFSVSQGILVTLLLSEIDKRNIPLDSRACDYWDGFIRYGKKQITLRHVLSHRTGLEKTLPRDLTISQLLNYEFMIRQRVIPLEKGLAILI
eukprot:GHVP01024931.1.p1 GENE.GHVP01024931.1~~GHVP01024931.1.p1  ORF type:complete len:620 (-),score=104.12 GHVP01024931.1:2066-3925(-)